MNLVDKLLASEKTMVEKATKTLKSKRLGRFTGAEFEEITIQEISGRKFGVVKDRGESGADAGYESNLLCCTFGIVNPDLKNKELQKKFWTTNPMDLAEKLFSGEVYQIAGEIVGISGLIADEMEAEKEVKN